jgi:putative toxin-antitoxin system antitoxin component (TIGR02293 family)
MATPSALLYSESQVRDGVPVGVVAQLTAALDISTNELLAWLHMPARTWARRKQVGSFDMLESDRIARLGRLIKRAGKVLGGHDAARVWLTTPSRALHGRTPFAAADTETGAEAVFDLLGRLEHGVFT